VIVPVGVILARSIWNPVFLALALWREARGSSIEAKVAVASSFRGQVDSPHGNTLMFYDVDHDWEAPVTGHV